MPRCARILSAVIAATASAVAQGCFSPPEGFDSVDPSGRMYAATQAAASHDEQAVPELVDMLSSDDPAERMVAIASLERITGRRMGYEPTASATTRNAAISRWETWLNEGRPPLPSKDGAAGPATVPAPRTDR